jgi:hypothetical protein
MRVLFWLLLTVVVAGLVHLTALGCCTDEALSLGLVMGALFLGSWFA